MKKTNGWYVVVDNAFNRGSYPDDIGKRSPTPFGYQSQFTEREILEKFSSSKLKSLIIVSEMKILFDSDMRLERMTQIAKEILQERAS